MMASYIGIFLLLIPLGIISIIINFSWSQLFHLIIQLIQLSDVLMDEIILLY